MTGGPNNGNHYSSPETVNQPTTLIKILNMEHFYGVFEYVGLCVYLYFNVSTEKILYFSFMSKKSYYFIQFKNNSNRRFVRGRNRTKRKFYKTKNLAFIYFVILPNAPNVFDAYIFIARNSSQHHRRVTTQSYVLRTGKSHHVPTRHTKIIMFAALFNTIYRVIFKYSHLTFVLQ